jgi:serine/threonine protein phosphatase PrpC
MDQGHFEPSRSARLFKGPRVAAATEGSGVRRLRGPSEELSHRAPEAEVFGITDRGCVRPTNQDQFLIADLERSMLVQRASLASNDGTCLLDIPQGRVLMVADGMGGYQGGEVASAIAVDVMARYTLAMMPWSLMASQAGEREVAEGLQGALDTCNERVRSVALERGLDSRMGTTLTMAYVAWPELYVLHVGDSRCYLYRGQQLFPLTRDHTVAQQLVESHALSEEEAAKSQFKHVLVNSIGGASDRVEMEFRHITLAPGDLLLLCTDGLTGQLSDAELSSYLARREPVERSARQMLEHAKRAGGEDNITVVLARF